MSEHLAVQKYMFCLSLRIEDPDMLRHLKWTLEKQYKQVISLFGSFSSFLQAVQERTSFVSSTVILDLCYLPWIEYVNNPNNLKEWWQNYYNRSNTSINTCKGRVVYKAITKYNTLNKLKSKSIFKVLLNTTIDLWDVIATWTYKQTNCDVHNSTSHHEWRGTQDYRFNTCAIGLPLALSIHFRQILQCIATATAYIRIDYFVAAIRSITALARDQSNHYCVLLVDILDVFSGFFLLSFAKFCSITPQPLAYIQTTWWQLYAATMALARDQRNHWRVLLVRILEPQKNNQRYKHELPFCRTSQHLYDVLWDECCSPQYRHKTKATVYTDNWLLERGNYYWWPRK